MQILAHRGAWLTSTEKNSRGALVYALKSGWGIETDIRDLDGELVISHDMPRRGVLPLETLFKDYVNNSCSGTLALNMKADGLANELKVLLARYQITRYFCFDMSVPDSMDYFSANMITAARLSEYEPEGELSQRASVLWVDGFSSNKVEIVLIKRWLASGKSVSFVSPELHQRDHEYFWQSLRSLPEELLSHSNMMLCTDFPEQAEALLK